MIKADQALAFFGWVFNALGAAWLHHSRGPPKKSCGHPGAPAGRIARRWRRSCQARQGGPVGSWLAWKQPYFDENMWKQSDYKCILGVDVQ